MRHLVFRGAIVSLSAWAGAANAAPAHARSSALSMKAETAVDALKAGLRSTPFIAISRFAMMSPLRKASVTPSKSLLSRKWSTLDGFRDTLRADKGFARFVVDHVDETWNRDDSKPVRESAMHHCPEGLLDFCKSIVTEIDDIDAKAKAP